MDLRSDFTSPPLVRLLGAWAPTGAAAPGADFAERFSHWLNAFDAIGLHAAHQAIRGIAAPAPRGRARFPARGDLREDLQRTRALLARVVSPPATAAGAPEDAGYAAWQERHLELQRQMDLLIPPLRAHAREALAHASTRLRQLAALDATLEQVLAAREQALLPRIGILLKRRFEQLRREQAEGWSERFGAEWRDALLGELDLRLAPVLGLAEALENEQDLQR